MAIARIILLVVALASGLVAWVFLSRRLDSQKDLPVVVKNDVAKIHVLFATNDKNINPGSLLDLGNNVEWRELPAGAYSKEMIVKEVSSNARLDLPTRFVIPKNSVVLRTQLGGKGSSLSQLVPAGNRAISIPITDVHAAAGLLQAGDRVDVLVVTSSTHSNSFLSEDVAGNHEVGSKPAITVLQNVMLLALNDHLVTDSIQVRDDNQGTQLQYATISVDQKQANILAGMYQDVFFVLALRGSEDNSTVHKSRSVFERVKVYYPKSSTNLIVSAQ